MKVPLLSHFCKKLQTQEKVIVQAQLVRTQDNMSVMCIYDCLCELLEFIHICGRQSLMQFLLSTATNLEYGFCDSTHLSRLSLSLYSDTSLSNGWRTEMIL